jgi:cellobiose dehydrogenase (acceptor)
LSAIEETLIHQLYPPSACFIHSLHKDVQTTIDSRCGIVVGYVHYPLQHPCKSVLANIYSASTQVSAKPIERRAAGDASFDYIVVGSGPGGVTVADKLSESGASVLLVERGQATTGQWNGQNKPQWLDNTGLTFYDVPALDDQIWTKGGDFTNNIFCPDIVGGISGCVLGGSGAINSGLWWKPTTWDWDTMFPAGKWSSKTMANVTDRVFSRLPGTEVPSQDGKLYLQQGADVIEGALHAANWTHVSANSVPNQKNKVYSNTTYMFQHGERSGPMSVYLGSAYSRPNFSLYTNAIVDRVIRQGSKITGVQISNTAADGFRGTVKANKAVVLAAGAFGTPKVLMRSGIGPRDQLEIVRNAEGSKMISQDQWINLPVGYNLMDNINTDIVISHPDVVYYDFAGLWNNPSQSDVKSYLNGRTGMLAQSASNLNPMVWEMLNSTTNGLQGLQWTARVDTSLNIPNDAKHNMVLAQYITIGQAARGRTTITSDLKMNVSTGVSVLEHESDQVAIAQGIENMVSILKKVPGLKVLSPPSGMSALDYVKSTTHLYVNHWLGSCKMGLDDGRKNKGTAVVDANSKVYGTDNLFIADGSIFPGQTTSNPQAAITIVGEHVAELILALKLSTVK